MLDAHGLRSIKVWAFATNALAAFVSPLLFGGMADRSGSPVLVLRGLSFAAAALAAMVGATLHFHWNPWLALGLIQATALCLAPAFSLISSIVLARLQSAQLEFGPIRAMATLGWIVGCWVISACHADSSALAVCLAAAASLLVCLCAGFVPPQESLRLVYSSELVCGVSNGVARGATGQMSTLLAEGKNVVARGEGFKVDRGRRRGLVSRDGAAKVWAGSFGIVRGKLSTLLRPKAGQDL
jgi:hypothetical protein